MGFTKERKKERNLQWVQRYDIVLIVNPIGKILVRWQSFKNNLRILCHPICNCRNWILYVLLDIEKWMQEYREINVAWAVEVCAPRAWKQILPPTAVLRPTLNAQISRRNCSTVVGLSRTVSNKVRYYVRAPCTAHGTITICILVLASDHFGKMPLFDLQVRISNIVISWEEEMR